ncbi:MAG: hypothetical protein ABI273_11040 [Lacunisphaera sp.]
MPTSVNDFKAEARTATLDLLWRQWITLGVSGHAAPTSGDVLLDPEALLLASTNLARVDPRLFDEMLDWLQDQADWINLQRLVRLQKHHALGDASVLAAIATRLHGQPAHKKWRALVKPPDPTTTLAPLFPTVGHFGATDPDFLSYGWQRGPVRYRGLATVPRMDQAGNFLLKLRALFGRQSRAEVMAWLLAHDSGHPAEIARQTGHFRRSIQLALNELERSGHIHARREAREKHFSIPRDDWRFLATWSTPSERRFPVWFPWAALFRLLEQLHALLEDETLAAGSPELQAIEWRRRLDYAPLAGSSLPAVFALPVNARGADALAAHTDRFRQLFALLATT